MTTTPQTSREIDGKGRTIRELLANRKYSIRTACSLHEHAYRQNPGFKRFIEESQIPFGAHTEFKKADIEARQRIYQKLAERIWDPERLQQEANT